MPGVFEQGAGTKRIPILMHKPRDVWTAAEREYIDQKAQATLELFAAQGDYVSYETCYMMAELGLVTKKLEEVKAGLRRILDR